MWESRSLSELTRQIAPPAKNGHALPPTESGKSYQFVNPFHVRAETSRVRELREGCQLSRPCRRIVTLHKREHASGSTGEEPLGLEHQPLIGKPARQGASHAGRALPD
ncbi:hypothetical protein chiPu_0020452 [Chiloscyllium punctatum]|uniref:Uncharacterized protein n=1 Tax=Chiloscyllium punctatum TaxID=137246 RepID=A0A401RFV4_CHIPU|nr:hypothetical protein [Chiloscyllium punctatum]